MGHTYSDGKGEWDVHRLWELAKDLPVQELDHEAFHEWEEYGWETNLTLSGLAEHIQRALAADTQYPVIVSAEGHIMDGCHRLLRAALDGVLVKMVRFEETPSPDRLLEPGDPEAPWRKGDPREVVGKRANIIILTGDMALLGQVDCKESWSIWTDHDFDRYKFIDPDDKWPDHWVWTWAPSKKRG